MDEVRELLTHRERRELLVALHRDGAPLHLDSLSLSLESLTERTSEADRCCARRYHDHVPKLESKGIVRYDEDHDVVELTDRGASLARIVAQ